MYALARAVTTTWAEFAIADETALSAWARGYRPTAKEAADLGAYDRGSSYASKSFAALRALGRPVDRIAYMYALSFPAADYLGDRHHGRLGRLGRGARQIGAKRRG